MLIEDLIFVKSIHQSTSNFTLKNCLRKYLSAAGSQNRPAVFYILPKLLADIITN